MRDNTMYDGNLNDNTRNYGKKYATTTQYQTPSTSDDNAKDASMELDQENNSGTECYDSGEERVPILLTPTELGSVFSLILWVAAVFWGIREEQQVYSRPLMWMVTHGVANKDTFMRDATRIATQQGKPHFERMTTSGSTDVFFLTKGESLRIAQLCSVLNEFEYRGTPCDTSEIGEFISEIECNGKIMPCKQNVITSWNREERRQTQELGSPIANTDINIVETLAKESEPLQMLNQAGRVDQHDTEITNDHPTDDETSPIIPEEQSLIRIIKYEKENRLHFKTRISIQIAHLCSRVTVLDYRRTMRRIPEIEKLLSVLDRSSSTTYCVSSVTVNGMEYARQEREEGITPIAQNCLSKPRVLKSWQV